MNRCFSLTRRQWCSEAERELMRAAHGDMAAIRADVESGAAVLWQGAGSSPGWIVTREEGDELVIVAGVGRNARPVLEFIRDQAAAAGMTVRTHIKRPGLQRMYERLGFTERERVMSYGRT